MSTNTINCVLDYLGLVPSLQITLTFCLERAPVMMAKAWLWP